MIEREVANTVERYAKQLDLMESSSFNDTAYLRDTSSIAFMEHAKQNILRKVESIESQEREVVKLIVKYIAEFKGFARWDFERPISLEDINIISSVQKSKREILIKVQSIEMLERTQREAETKKIENHIRDLTPTDRYEFELKYNARTLATADKSSEFFQTEGKHQVLTKVQSIERQVGSQ